MVKEATICDSLFVNTEKLLHILLKVTATVPQCLRGRKMLLTVREGHSVVLVEQVKVHVLYRGLGGQ
jgi:hypothetical protein